MTWHAYALMGFDVLCAFNVRKIERAFVLVLDLGHIVPG